MPLRWARYGGLVLACLLHPGLALATWPVDGAPVGVAPTTKELHSVVADGDAAVFVTWKEYSAVPPRIRLQRVLVDGSRAAGWPAEGVHPGASLRGQQWPFVVPDGTGGCFVAWWDEHEFWGIGAVYLQHILATGAKDPAWPGPGVLVAAGYYSPSGIGSSIFLQGLEPLLGGGCIVLLRASHFGCHDGFCSSGGSASLHRMSPSGAMSSALEIAGCGTSAPGFLATSDGADGVLALIQSPCIPGGVGFRHVRVGTEPVTSLETYTEMSSSELWRTAAGSVLGVRATYPGGGQVPVVHHWNFDGTPAAGAPPTGRMLPSAPQWSLAADPTGSSYFVWRPTGTPSMIRTVKLEPDLSTTPGWDPSGNPWITAPAVADRFATTSDGAGGAYVVWIDPRKGISDFDVYASHITATGQIAPSPATGGLPLCQAPGIQAEPQVVRLGPDRIIAVWQDSRSGAGVDIYAQRFQIDVPVPTLFSLRRLEVFPSFALVEWQLSRDVPEVVVERTRDGESWSARARFSPEGLRRVQYRDTDVRPGERWGYRLAIEGPDGAVHSEITWATIPSDRLGVRAIGPISASRLELEITLPFTDPARLELVDLAGRRLHSVDLSAKPAGTHQVELMLGDIPSGVAWLTLRQGAARHVLRLPILR